MALTTRSPGQQPIDSSAVNQFVQALTGVMTDQAFTLANNVAMSSNVTVTGILSASTFNSSALITGSSALRTSSTITSSAGGIVSMSGLTSSQRTAFTMGSSGPTIQFGSSIPTSACVAGSIFLNAGGSSTTVLYVCMPNSGTASSSNWDNITGYA